MAAAVALTWHSASEEAGGQGRRGALHALRLEAALDELLATDELVAAAAAAHDGCRVPAQAPCRRMACQAGHWLELRGAGAKPAGAWQMCCSQAAVASIEGRRRRPQ